MNASASGNTRAWTAVLGFAASVSLAAACAGGGAGGSVRENTAPRATSLVAWPTPKGERPVDRTIKVKGSMDGGLVRFYGVEELATNDQDEHQGAIFDLEDGATLSNVILGDPAADGIHCRGTCTLENVWWERVGEDAATFRGTDDGQVMSIVGGGASGARDKVFQHNGRGTMVIRNFYVEQFGKLYRSCGNCKTQYKRAVVVENVTAVAGPRSKALVGVNENYGDVAEFRGRSRVFDASGKVKVCLRYEGNSAGAEPTIIGDGPDGTTCKYSDETVVVSR